MAERAGFEPASVRGQHSVSLAIGRLWWAQIVRLVHGLVHRLTTESSHSSGQPAGSCYDSAAAPHPVIFTSPKKMRQKIFRDSVTNTAKVARPGPRLLTRLRRCNERSGKDLVRDRSTKSIRFPTESEVLSAIGSCVGYDPGRTQHRIMRRASTRTAWAGPLYGFAPPILASAAVTFSTTSSSGTPRFSIRRDLGVPRI